MNHNQQISAAGQSDNHEALLSGDLILVRDGDGKRIFEDCARLCKTEAVLPKIRRVLSPVPFKGDSVHLSLSLSALDYGLAPEGIEEAIRCEAA